MATDTLWGYDAHTRRMVHASIRAMQKPKIMPEMMNLRPRRRLTWRSAMCVTAPMTNNARNTAVMGLSSCFVGCPPRPAVLGG